MTDMEFKVLAELKKNQCEYVSGEKLCAILGVSRTAIWKYIKEIKKQGYIIDSSTKKGYKLMPSPDVLNAYEITNGLKTELIGKRVYYFDSIDSTNDYAKKIAAAGCEDGAVVVAGRQTSGRGRMGRTWYSEGGKGIWMSVVLKPSILPQEVQLVTLGASVAVIRSIRNSTGFEAGIKWPNDVVLDGKKLCGILSEMSCEEENVNFVVVGIGINVHQKAEDFPAEVRDLAISLDQYAEMLGKTGFLNIERTALVKNILFEMEKIYSKINKGLTKDIIDEWKEYSATLGKRVSVTIKGSRFEGVATDIEEDGRLVVDCDDGTRRKILSGEIQVRGILGYI